MCRVCLALLLVITAAHNAYAQQPRAPHGTHSYEVRGFYEGQAMQPWLSQTIVRDTLIDGKPQLAVTYQSRHSAAAGGWLYTYTAVMAGTDVSTRWVGNGRAQFTCQTRHANNQIIADIDGRDKATSSTLQRGAIPDFAVAWVLAGRPLADHDSVKLSLYRCVPAADVVISLYELNAVVSSGSQSRTEGNPPEAVWIITGDKSFPYVAHIAKSDRQVLKVLMPQGTVGEMVDVYVSSRK
jgi:hypothetical protein